MITKFFIHDACLHLLAVCLQKAISYLKPCKASKKLLWSSKATFCQRRTFLRFLIFKPYLNTFNYLIQLEVHGSVESFSQKKYLSQAVLFLKFCETDETKNAGKPLCKFDKHAIRPCFSAGLKTFTGNVEGFLQVQRRAPTKKENGRSRHSQGLRGVEEMYTEAFYSWLLLVV